MTTQRIRDFLATRRPDGPCLVVDLDVVKDNFKAFRHALPDSMIYYAVKANPAPEILKLLGVQLTVAGAFRRPAVGAHLHHHAAAALGAEPGWLQAQLRGGRDCSARGLASVDVELGSH